MSYICRAAPLCPCVLSWPIVSQASVVLSGRYTVNMHQGGPPEAAWQGRGGTQSYPQVSDLPPASHQMRPRLFSWIEISWVSGLSGLASVEAYSYKTNEWFFVAPMNTRRSSVGVGVVEGKKHHWAAAFPCPCPGLVPTPWLYSFHHCWVRFEYPDGTDEESWSADGCSYWLKASRWPAVLGGVSRA